MTMPQGLHQRKAGFNLSLNVPPTPDFPVEHVPEAEDAALSPGDNFLLNPFEEDSVIGEDSAFDILDKGGNEKPSAVAPFAYALAVIVGVCAIANYEHMSLSFDALRAPAVILAALSYVYAALSMEPRTWFMVEDENTKNSINDSLPSPVVFAPIAAYIFVAAASNLDSLTWPTADAAYAPAVIGSVFGYVWIATALVKKTWMTVNA